MVVSGKTRIAGIFGYPIGHTLSPLMHNAAFDAVNFDACYVAFKVAPHDLPDAVKSIMALDMLGVNITVPHKEAVIPLLDSVDAEASFIGAVNTIVCSGGQLSGFNTDGRGFMRSLEERQISVEGKEVFVIGAGGASRAISYYLSESTSKLLLYDIELSKAENLVNDLQRIRDNVFLLDDLRAIGKPDVIVNATPLGLKPDDPPPIHPEFIRPGMIICDLVYTHTRFLAEAESKGAGTLDGSGMLLWQGALAFQLWTGIEPPVDVMRRALLSHVK